MPFVDNAERAREIVAAVEKKRKERETEVFGVGVLGEELPDEAIPSRVMYELEILERFANNVREYVWNRE